MRSSTEPADQAARHQFQALLERAEGVQAAPCSQVAAPQAAATCTSLPAIKAPWPGVDGIYIGVTTAPDGRIYALVSLNVRPPKQMTWTDAVEWAKQQGGELPNQVEGALLFANARDQFEPNWHWLSTQYSYSYAWIQGFSNGDQGIGSKSYEGWAVAVRRFPLQSFVPLVSA